MWTLQKGKLVAVEEDAISKVTLTDERNQAKHVHYTLQRESDGWIFREDLRPEYGHTGKHPTMGNAIFAALQQPYTLVYVNGEFVTNPIS